MKDLPLRARVVVRTSKMKIDKLRQKIAPKGGAARAVRLFFLIEPIKSLIYDVVVVVAVVIS